MKEEVIPVFTRELSTAEWRTFFDCFSRRFRDQPMTVGLSETPEGRADIVAEQLPLVGITVEPAEGTAELIAVMMGDSPHENVVHVVREPCRVRVGQITGGEDEVVIIDSGAGPTTRLDFRPVPANVGT